MEFGIKAFHAKWIVEFSDIKYSVLLEGSIEMQGDLDYKEELKIYLYPKWQPKN